MGISFVPPWGQQLGDSLSKIATGVRDVIDPEAERRKQIEEHVLSNPEFAQQLADMEYQNPGAITKNMSKFFSRDASGLISSLAPSMNARISRIVRDNADLITHDPTIAQDIVSRAMTGRTPAQRTVEGAQQDAVNEYTNSDTFNRDMPEAGASTAFPGMVRARTQRDVTMARIRDADLRNEANNARIVAMTQGGWENARAVAEIYASMQRDRDFARFSSDDRSTVNSLMNSINLLQNNFDTPNANEETRNSTIAGINRNIAQVNQILTRYGQQPISANVTPGRGTVMGVQVPGLGRKKLLYTQGGEPIDINEFSTQLSRAVVPGGNSINVGSTHEVGGVPAMGNRPPVTPRSTTTPPENTGLLRAQSEILRRNHNITDTQMKTGGWSDEQIARIRRLSGVPAPRQ